MRKRFEETYGIKEDFLYGGSHNTSLFNRMNKFSVVVEIQHYNADSRVITRIETHNKKKAKREYDEAVEHYRAEKANPCNFGYFDSDLRIKIVSCVKVYLYKNNDEVLASTEFTFPCYDYSNVAV